MINKESITLRKKRENVSYSIHNITHSVHGHGSVNMERSFHKFIIELIFMNEYKVIELGT